MRCERDERFWPKAAARGGEGLLCAIPAVYLGVSIDRQGLEKGMRREFGLPDALGPRIFVGQGGREINFRRLLVAADYVDQG